MSWGRWSPCQIYAGTYNWGDVGKHIRTKYNQRNMDEPTGQGVGDHQHNINEPTCQGVDDHQQMNWPPCEGVGDHQQSKTLRLKWSSQRSDICLSVNESSLCFAPYQLREKGGRERGREREREREGEREGEREREKRRGEREGGPEREIFYFTCNFESRFSHQLLWHWWHVQGQLTGCCPQLDLGKNLKRRDPFQQYANQLSYWGRLSAELLMLQSKYPEYACSKTSSKHYDNKVSFVTRTNVPCTLKHKQNFGAIFTIHPRNPICQVLGWRQQGDNEQQQQQHGEISMLPPNNDVSTWLWWILKML